uniref:hypothetical protein n=1 Tax=uncultured Methanosphaera sp. TaxID=262501 RepID=UPI002591701B
GTKINISIKTQLKTILIDDTKKQSEINNYQSPQIITLPIITVEPLLFDSGDNTQNILFNMKNRQELYYTIDGTNPKNSTTTKKITSGDGSQYNPEIYHIISNKTILKYYVKDELGLVSEVYTYRSIRNQYEKATITILNTTPLYKKGAINTRQEEKIKIQTNKRGITLLKNDGEVYYYDDIILNNTSTVLFKQDTETTIKEYTLQKGLRTRMNYTYTMNIPYQILKITINSKTIINLNNQTVINNLKNDKYYLYDYQTNTYKITTNKTLNKPGTLIYLTDKNKNITIRTYDYCYGDVNQVSIVKEWMTKNTIKISVINNCIKNEIASLYLPVLTYIDCYFKSNDFYRFDYVKDYLSLSKLENNGVLESVETYILTNKKITYDILKEWIQKYPSYNRSVYKSCYGTFLTGLTHLYLHNAMISAIDYKINVTSYVSQNTQMCVFITYSGQTIVNIGDGYHGTRIISNNETNIRIHKFLNGYICSYLEDLVLYMAGDNGSGSACTYFMQDVFNYKTINFTYDNNTGNMEIHTQNNNDYYIRIYPDGSAGWYVSNNRNEFKTIKSSTNSNLTFNEISMVNEMSGGIGTKNYGFNYESSATELMVDRISDLDKILSWGSKNLNLTGFEWEVINTAENMGGSVLIGTGVVLLCASGVGLIPIALIAGGSTLCYFATGVNGVNDLVNPYYAIKASWSISEAIVTSVIGGPFGGLEEVTAVSMTEGLYMEIKESMRVALARNNLDRIKNIPLAIEDYIVGKFQDWELDYVLNHTRRYVPS